MADPMYRQIAEDLRRQIEAGELAPGAQLRTELELREKYEASRNTVRDAIKWLTTRGLVETRPGQGTFVVQKIVPFITTLTGDPEAGERGPYLREVKARRRNPEPAPRVEIQVAEPEMAGDRLPNKGATVVSRHQQIKIDRHSLVAADLVLSAQASSSEVRHALTPASDIEEGAVGVPAQRRWHRAGWLPGHHHRTGPRRGRSPVLRAGRRRPRFRHRNQADGVRPAGHAHPADRQRLPGRPQPACSLRRPGAGRPGPGAPRLTRKSPREPGTPPGSGTGERCLSQPRTPRGPLCRRRKRSVRLPSLTHAFAPRPVTGRSWYLAAGPARHGAMTDNLRIRRGTTGDADTIIGMIDEAADWLRGKGTDQWARPWPNRSARDGRVRRGLRNGHTWIVEAARPIATITYRPHGNRNSGPGKRTRRPRSTCRA